MLDFGLARQFTNSCQEVRPVSIPARACVYAHVAQLLKHDACNARVVGSIPIGDQYEKSMNMYALPTVNHSG